MASNTPRRLVTERDLEILAALDRCPLTAVQLQKISQTFASPFRTERRVRKRLHLLCEAGRLHRWPYYASAGRGAPNYYALSRLGYHILHGTAAAPPTKRAFAEVGIARQHHTYALAEFIVHTAVAAHRAGIAFTEFHRENTLRLTLGDEALSPDAAFQLVEPGGAAYNFFVEVDASTERLRSSKNADSWEKKIRFYDRFQDASPKRFRVLILTTRSSERANRILETAGSLVRNPHRSLFYAAGLPRYLTESEALTAPVFRDHRGTSVSLMPQAIQPVAATASLRRSLAVA
jgi:hypothetical protein